MKTEAEIRFDIIHLMEAMQKSKNASKLSQVEILKDVLEEEGDFFALPCDAYKNEGIRLAVAEIPHFDNEKEELSTNVKLYDRNGELINETNGWLVSEVRELEGYRYAEVLSRKLFVPNLNVCLNWYPDKDDFIKNGKPIAVWKDPKPDIEPVMPDEVIGWANIETGETLSEKSYSKN